MSSDMCTDEKIIQIAGVGDRLYALSDQGEVYILEDEEWSLVGRSYGKPF